MESRGVRKELDNNQRWIFVAIGKGLITTNVSKNNEIFAFPADDPSSHFADQILSEIQGYEIAKYFIKIPGGVGTYSTLTFMPHGAL